MFEAHIDGDGNQTNTAPDRREISVTSAVKPVKVKPPAAVAASQLNRFSLRLRNQIIDIIFF